MALRKLRPVTPSSRGQSVSDFAEITRSTPEKSLIRPINSRGGRNASGKITTRHQGGGHKRAYRVIDFLRNDKDGVPAVIAQIEYDPNRSARIALVHFADGEKRYIIAPLGVEQGTKIENGPTAILISVLLASGATMKVYLFSSSMPYDFSETTGAIKTSR